jgi:hypothetical protein
MNKLTDFGKGIIAGAVGVLLLFCIIFMLMYFNKRDRGLMEYVEKQMEIEAMREDVSNREPAEFVDTIPDVRRAADRAAADFERKRDEAVQRFRNRPID